MKYSKEEIAEVVRYVRERFSGGDLLLGMKMLESLTEELEAAEKRCLTDDEIATLRTMHLQVPNTTSELGPILDRIAPQPIEWNDVGEGSIAELNGWTMVIRPSCGGGGFFWCVSQHGRCDGAGQEHVSTVSLAKAAAESWARSH